MAQDLLSINRRRYSQSNCICDLTGVNWKYRVGCPTFYIFFKMSMRHPLIRCVFGRWFRWAIEKCKIRSFSVGPRPKKINNKISLSKKTINPQLRIKLELEQIWAGPPAWARPRARSVLRYRLSQTSWVPSRAEPKLIRYRANSWAGPSPNKAERNPEPRAEPRDEPRAEPRA